MVCVLNATPVVREGYRLGVPRAGVYRELINTDAGAYGGSGVGNLGSAQAEAVPSHGFPCSMRVTLPPLAVVWFEGPAVTT